MKKLKHFLLLCFCFVMFSSVVVYAADTPSYNLVVSAKDYKWYAQDGALTVASCRHDADNTFYSWSFYAFSKNDSSKKCKQETSSGEAYGNISLSLKNHGTALVDTYGWTEDEANYVIQNFTYLGSFAFAYNTKDGSTVYDHNEHVLLDYVQTSNPSLVQIVNDLKPYFFDDEAWKDGNYKPTNKDDNKLPMLHYKISSKNVISFPNIIDKKISIDWDFSNLEPYASNPMDYAIEILISANFYPNSEGERICWDALNSSINESCKRYLDTQASLLNKPFTFIYLKEGDALYSSTNHIFATDELQDGYYLYIRSYSKDGTKSSNYKVYKCTTGGTSGQMDLTYDTEGNEHPLDESDRDENGDYSNEYDEDSSSSADETPTGDSYDGDGGYSFDTLYGNLKSMVNMLQGVPELWANVMSWLPSWFPTFIVTMMGLLVVIGVLKYIF